MNKIIEFLGEPLIEKIGGWVTPQDIHTLDFKSGKRAFCLRLCLVDVTVGTIYGKKRTDKDIITRFKKLPRHGIWFVFAKVRGFADFICP